MGFSPDWLALREPADHRSRDVALRDRLTTYLKHKTAAPRLIDIGCGTGSNLRALAPVLGPQQSWVLVDYDPRLLARAREALATWADATQITPTGLMLTAGGARIDVRFVEADLVNQFDAVLNATTAFDVLTASAFFDLASDAFIRRCAAACADHRAAFYTVLTYNGINTWTPEHPADAVLLEAFNRDQKTDKGLLGVAAGPDAPRSLAESFRQHRYTVAEAQTPWQLGPADQALLADLVPGFAGACLKTGRVDRATVEQWLQIPRTAGIVGHVDTLALPG